MFQRGKKFLSDYFERRRLERRVLHGARKRRTEESELAHAADHSVVLGCFMLVLVWGTCLLLLALAGSHRYEDERLVLGQIAPRTVNVAFDFIYEDKAATAATQGEAARSAPLYYQISSGNNARIRQTLQQFLTAVDARRQPDKTVGGPHAEILQQLSATLDPATVKAITNCTGNPAAFRFFEEKLNELLSGGILSEQEQRDIPPGHAIRVVDLRQRERLSQKRASYPTETEAGRQLAAAMLHFHPKDDDFELVERTLSVIFREQIGPAGNLVPDEQRTRQGRLAAIEQVGTVTREVKKHHPLIVKGEVVDEEMLEMLKTYSGLAAKQETRLEDWGRNIDLIFWSLALVIMSAFYLYHIHPEVVNSNRQIAMVGSVVVISLLFNYAGLEFFNMILPESKHLSPPMVINAVPIALVAVLISTFMGLRSAIGAGFFVISITTMMLDLSFDFALKGVVVCAITALIVRHSTNYRSFFMRAVFSITPLIWVLNANFLSSASDWRTVGDIALNTALLALGNGLVTAFVALLLVFLYELVLKVSTNMSLMVLCDYNHPLLERLKREAPGTFFHSLMVATLAEDAARAIGANPLKAKAGALFHDIGKLFKPQYFTENNRDTGNKHTKLTPHMSSIIIRDHVKEGLEMARRYKLGRIVREAIEQHHGNDLVSFFYNKAIEQSLKTGETVSEAEFRYTGSPPQSRETAIISLADACEAACRSIDRPSASRIEALVNEIFEHRFASGQLAHADMTLADLEKVKISFINTLLSMKHGRIAYNQTPRDYHGNKPDYPPPELTQNFPRPPKG